MIEFKDVNELEFKAFLKNTDIPGFLISEEIRAFAQELLVSEYLELDTWGDLVIPEDAIRHTTAMAFAIPRVDAVGTYWVLMLDEPEGEPDGSPYSIVYGFTDSGSVPAGRFRAGGNLIIDIEHKDAPAKDHDDMSWLVAMVAFILSVINQPRVVKLEHLASRRDRRVAQRGGAKAANAWHRVTWDLSKPTAARIARDPNFHKVPLHWRRGHFRRAEAHYQGAVQRPDAVRPEERDLWWQWIGGQWVGHPAFGVKRSVHAPKLSTGKLASRPVFPVNKAQDGLELPKSFSALPGIGTGKS